MSVCEPMRKRRKRVKPGDVWINPNSNLKGARGNRAFDERFGDRSASRYLELADVALGLKKPIAKKKRIAIGAQASTQKTESYVKTEPLSSKQ
jgi:hypothetical protein